MDMFKADVHTYPSYITVYTFLCMQQVKSDTSDDHASKRNIIKIRRVNFNHLLHDLLFILKG